MKNYSFVKIQKNLGRMAQVICLFFVIFSSDVFAQTLRSTTFDNRNICEDSKGVWRQFGNGCADDCEAQFDRFNMCTQSLVFACDCGKSRCWNGESCVLMQEYKKVFDVKQAENQKILDEAKEKRKADAAVNNAALMARFLPKDQNGNPIYPSQNLLPNSANNPNPEVLPAPTNPETNILPVTEIEPNRITELTPEIEKEIKEDPEKKIELPPFILKKQAKEEEQQKKVEEVKEQKKVEDSKPLLENSLPPGLPVIPLPN